MDISIIIPAFEESVKIVADIIHADDFINENRLTGEIIIVDDGSRDATSETALELKEKLRNRLTVLRNDKNLGKGNAVKKGVLNSEGDLVLYHDAGSTVPLHNALAGIELLRNGNYDIAIGSRKLPESKIVKGQELDRKVVSKIFGFITGIFFGPVGKFSDTQCGFKIYKGDIARELYASLEVNGFMFEIEILLRALKKRYRVTEFPVEWRCDRDSRISLLKSPWKVFSDLLKIRKMEL
jgi:dolichyl-phosphate beta-glucosyltransferase